MQPFTVSEVARQLGSRPRDISDLFYSRELSEVICPIVGGRRLIPPGYVPVIEASLRSHGYLGEKGSAGGARPATETTKTDEEEQTKTDRKHVETSKTIILKRRKHESE